MKKSGIELAAVATVPSSSSSPSVSPPSSSSVTEKVADIVLGIDPDTRGAMAVLFREGRGSGGKDEERKETSFSSSSPSITRTSTGNFFISAVHDTPTVEVPLGRGTLKKPPKTRRRLDATAVSSLIAELKNKAESEGKSLEACVEQPSPSPLNGKLAWYGSGLAFGIWSGVLAAHGVRTSFVRPQEWKRAFGLEGGGKDAARAAAVAALDEKKSGGGEEEEEEEDPPQPSPSVSMATTTTAAALLTRKKDHGRADAMLIALWRARGGAGWGGLGADAAAAAAEVEALALASAEVSGEEEEEEEEEEATTADETDGTEFDDDDEEEEAEAEESSESSSSSGSDEDETTTAAAASKGKKKKGSVKAAASAAKAASE